MKYLIYFIILFSILQLACKKKEQPARKTKSKTPKKTTETKKPDFSKPERKKEEIPVFTFYTGANEVPAFKKGEKVWSPVPVDNDWKIVNYSICDVKEIIGYNVLLKNGKTEFKVPGAILDKVKKTKKKFKKGDAVLVNLGMSSEWGKVQKVKKTSLVVAFLWANEVERKVVKPEMVKILPDKKAVPGAPLIYKKNKKWKFGQLIYSIEGKTCLIGFAGKLEFIDNHNIHYQKYSRKFSLKKRVWIPWLNYLEEGKILKILPEGVGYEVLYFNHPRAKFRNPRKLSFARVVKPLG
ncbi:MAG: hypothetical protein ACQES9_12410 [Myxococcota bacterium]